MTTPPIQTLTDELLGEIEAAANDVRGWTMREYFQEPEEGFLPADWEWYVGSIDEDGNRYPLLNVNAHQYDSEDSEKLAKYYALVNRDDVLAMASELRTLRAENAELRKDAERYRWLRLKVNVDRYGVSLPCGHSSYRPNETDTAIDNAMPTGEK